MKKALLSVFAALLLFSPALGQTPSAEECLIVERPRLVDIVCEEEREGLYYTLIKTKDSPSCPNKVITAYKDPVDGYDMTGTATRAGVDNYRCETGVMAGEISIAPPGMGRGSYPPPVPLGKDGQDRRVIVFNFTSTVIDEVRDGAHSKNLLQQPLQPGQSAVVDFDDGLGYCKFLMESYSGGELYSSLRDTNVCEVVQWRLYDDDSITD